MAAAIIYVAGGPIQVGDLRGAFEVVTAVIGVGVAGKECSSGTSSNVGHNAADRCASYVDHGCCLGSLEDSGVAAVGQPLRHARDLLIIHNRVVIKGGDAVWLPNDFRFA